VTLLPLDNPIMPYAWGSPTAIPRLLGRENPEGAPWAELWMGAHPKAPSIVDYRGERWALDALIDREPGAILGAAAAARGGGLPFLFKVLAAGSPLSIQCHPDKAQAAAGFAREEALGIPRDAPNRSYRDANHKPELIVALTPFTALKGFRAVMEIREGLATHVPLALLPERALLDEPGGLRRFFSALMNLPGERRAAVLETALRRSAPGGWVHRLHRYYPGDIGALAPLILNMVTLQPGEALFLQARELHAYLEGVGLEVMANSDNVLRGGLTKKHVDVPELLSTLNFDPIRPRILSPEPVGPAEARYDTPAPEFALSVIDLCDGQAFDAPAERGVEILLVVSGAGQAECGGASRPIRQGDALLAPASAGAYRLSGEGRVYRVLVERA